MKKKPRKRSSAPLSLRAYAKRRGCSAEAVSKAIQSGRLRESVAQVDGAPKIRDPDLADREWAASTDRTRSPISAVHDPDGDLQLQEELARAKHWEANLKEQKFREREGELVETKVVEKKVADLFTRVKTHLLGVPSRAKQLIPHLSTAEVGILEELVREALEELVQEDQDAPQEAAG